MRQEPSLDQIVTQWLALWEMSVHLLTLTPAAILREWHYSFRR